MWKTRHRPLSLALIAGAALSSASALLLGPGDSAAAVRINEILANPTGDDIGTERIEIYNTGPDSVNMTGWGIEDATTIDDATIRARIPEDFDAAMCPNTSAVIAPGEFRVIKGTTTAPFLNNTGDDVYLVANRTLVPPAQPIIHQVTYPNTATPPDGFNKGWGPVPDGSSTYAWRTLTLCGTNCGAVDTIPPSVVSDLAAAPGDNPGEVRLTWTAPGNDGATGIASEYRIRVAYTAINSGNFGAAADLERWTLEPLPSTGGTAETWIVFGLSPDSTYFFALQTRDCSGNTSGVSNSPSSAPGAGNLPNPDLGYQAYFGNLHSHTSYSDGVQTPTQAYAYARNTAPTPLDFLAVTDHNHVSAGMSYPNYAQGLSEAASANSDGNFVAIWGQEWGLASNGHVNIFESPKLFGWDAGQYDVFVAEGDYAGLYTAALANPPASYPPIGEWCHPAGSDFDSMQVTANGKAFIHLMALVNGPAQSSSTTESDIGNTNFDGVFGLALMKGYRVSPTADQDNHQATWGASSQSRTGVLATAKTKSAILGALAARRAYATQDHNTRVDFWADGHAMGEAFSAPDGIQIAARVTDPDVGETVSSIELFRGVTGSSVAALVAGNAGNSEFYWRELQAFAPLTEAHYYLRIRMSTGARNIWTGPVYVIYDPALPTAVGDEARRTGIFLGAPSPNPASGPVSITLRVPVLGGRVRLGVFDLSGRLVRRLLDEPLPAGERTITWDGRAEGGAPVHAGLYIIRLDAGGTSVSRKTLRLR